MRGKPDRIFSAGVAAMALAGALLASGCGDAAAPLAMASAVPQSPPPVSADSHYVENGDLDAIERRGKLRILVPLHVEAQSTLPRQGLPVIEELELAREFARSRGLEPLVAYVEEFADLIPALLAGEGDLIAANLTVTETRKRQIAFTIPLEHVREQLVVRDGDSSVTDVADLAHRTVAVKASTSFHETLLALSQRVPGLEIEALDEATDPQQVFDRLVAGDFDYTVADSNLVESTRRFRQDIRAAIDLGPQRAIAWGLRPDAASLRSALDGFLLSRRLTEPRAATALGDLDAIQKRGVIRMLTRNNGASYYSWRGELLGFEYELAREFARSLSLRLEVVVAPSHGDLVPWLLEGRGDFIAAFLRPTEARKRRGVAFSAPHHHARELVVGRAGEQIDAVGDLRGRRLVVRESSSYWQTLAALRRHGAEFELAPAPEHMETEEIIGRVAAGEFDLTVADEHILELELTWRDDVEAMLPLTERLAQGWAVRHGDQRLLAAIDRYLTRQHRSTFYNLTHRKYFAEARRARQHREGRLDLNPDGTISPYDDTVRAYAQRYGFDWRLLVSQMYEESRFDPDAKSWAGARGLMQVMPRTARHMGFERIPDADSGIHAGVKYMDWVRDRFEDHLAPEERVWFTMAAYNAGVGHVRDARDLAARKGWDPDRWFDNVENAMLLLSQPRYAERAAHGYVRGGEPVNYVRNIRDRYRAYVQMAAGGSRGGVRSVGANPARPAPPYT